jgi:hypothetical protein
VAGFERWAKLGGYVVCSVGGIEQSLSSRRDVALAVKQKVANLFAEFGAARLERANNFAAVFAHKLL